MNFEEAKRLGNRHLTGNEKFEIHSQNGKPRVVRVTASRSVAATSAGQHCLWMLTNLLARQFGIITALRIDVPHVPSVPGVAHFGSGQTLQEMLFNTAKLVAGDALDIGCTNRQEERVDAEAGVGHYQPEASFAVAALADGWRVLVGKPGVIPTFVPTSNNPFGPYFGACLAAGEIFKHLASLRPGCGRVIESLAFSLWDYQKSDSWESTDPGLWPGELVLPPIYLVGAGAVGQAAIASLAACPSIGGYATIIDDEEVDATNRNRYALAHSDNLGKKKVVIAAEALARQKFQTIPYPGRWEAYVQGIDRPQQRADVKELERKWRFQRILSCVDKNGPRHSIQNVWPELILGGSTLECGILVQAYDLRTNGECLKCSNPIKEDGRTIEGEATRWKQMTPIQRRQIAEQKGLDIQAIEAYLNDPKCGQLGEQEIAKFALDPRQDWSVGFVSVAAGVLLAAKLVQSEIGGLGATFPPLRGQALRFSFLNAGPIITRHTRREACDCSGRGADAYSRLWGT
jgi:molybdopterin/thiamine biosynthesis adenylyltransferase